MHKKAIIKDKQTISNFLEISARTLDRYVKKHNLTVFTEKGKKKLDLVETLNAINSQNLRQLETDLDNFRQFETSYVKESREKELEIKKKTGLDSLRQEQVKQQKNQEKSSLNKQKDRFRQVEEKENVEKFSGVDLSSYQNFQKEAEIYKKLYKNVSAELKLKQERLEGATYRVGQLEAQIKNSVPLLSYRQKEEEMLHLEEIQQKEREKQLKEKAKMEKALYESRLIKNIYTTLLFTLLILIPFVLIYLFNT